MANEMKLNLTAPLQVEIQPSWPLCIIKLVGKRIHFLDQHQMRLGKYKSNMSYYITETVNKFCGLAKPKKRKN